MADADILVIGAGVVGLAVAEKLSGSFDNIVVADRHEKYGQETSSRSSEVIHAGIYYHKGTLKSRLCVRGNELLYQICRENNIPHSNSGKLLIANDEKSISKLPGLFNQALGNDAKNFRIVDEDEIHEIEPNVNSKRAIYFPTSGYVDSEKLGEYFEKSALNNGTTFLYNHEVVGIDKIDSGYKVKLKTSLDDIYEITAKIVVNSAGLHSDKIAELAGIDADKNGYKINYHKGIYFRAVRQLDKYPKVLIYPVPPEAGSVGIHTTPDMYGGMRLGPHFFWSDKIDYSVDDSFHEFFYNAVRSYLPFVEYDDLQPDMSGIMSAVQKPGENVLKDFIIKDEIEKGLPGLINLIGIESPGLTASPAIAEYVSDLIKVYF